MTNLTKDDFNQEDLEFIDLINWHVDNNKYTWTEINRSL